MERFICDKCKLQYRLESDFEEHKRVGCRMKSAKKNAPTFSDKDVDQPLELPADVAQELVNEVLSEPEKPKKSSKKK